eukprot:822026-Amphidinium_carterae.1
MSCSNNSETTFNNNSTHSDTSSFTKKTACNLHANGVHGAGEPAHPKLGQLHKSLAVVMAETSCQAGCQQST